MKKFLPFLTIALVALVGVPIFAHANPYAVLDEQSGIAVSMDVTIVCTYRDVTVTLNGNPTQTPVHATFEGGKGTLTADEGIFYWTLAFGNNVPRNLNVSAVGGAVTMQLVDGQGNELTEFLWLPRCGSSTTTRVDFSRLLVPTASALAVEVIGQKCSSRPVYRLRLGATFVDGVSARFSFGGIERTVSIVPAGGTARATSSPIAALLAGNGASVTYTLPSAVGDMTIKVLTGPCKAQLARD